MSTKLKLLGVDVGSFGDAFGATPGARVVSIFDGAASVYKKLVAQRRQASSCSAACSSATPRPTAELLPLASERRCRCRSTRKS